MEYELFYLVGVSKEAGLEKIKGEAENVVKNSGGVFLEKITTEKRRLSYVVKHETHGVYIARRFELEKPENLKEITNKLNLNANILRFIISRAEDLPELKSKEERMEEATKMDARPKLKKEEKPEIKKPEIKKEAKKAPEKIKDEDIDKKLEEILNI